MEVKNLDMACKQKKLKQEDAARRSNWIRDPVKIRTMRKDGDAPDTREGDMWYCQEFLVKAPHPHMHHSSHGRVQIKDGQ